MVEDNELELEGDFFDEQSAASQIKIRIVTKYFSFWSRVMVPVIKKGPTKKLAYIDLYSGPGVYRNGSPSTPILILTQVASDPDLAQALVSVFNDKNPVYATALAENINKIPGIGGLRYAPQIKSSEIDASVEEYFNGVRIVPTFTFVDPFGYKGVTLKLLRGMLKDWGCDLLLFFSYMRINAAITNPTVEDHVEALFGKDRLNALREALIGKKPFQREALILEAFTASLNQQGFRFVLPFTFAQADKKRTSHHLIFVTKNELAHRVMKEIMAKESSEFDEGVPSFAYSGAMSATDTPLLFKLTRPIEELGRQLLIPG